MKHTLRADQLRPKDFIQLDDEWLEVIGVRGAGDDLIEVVHSNGSDLMLRHDGVAARPRRYKL